MTGRIATSGPTPVNSHCQHQQTSKGSPLTSLHVHTALRASKPGNDYHCSSIPAVQPCTKVKQGAQTHTAAARGCAVCMCLMWTCSCSERLYLIPAWYYCLMRFILPVNHSAFQLGRGWQGIANFVGLFLLGTFTVDVCYKGPAGCLG